MTIEEFDKTVHGELITFKSFEEWREYIWNNNRLEKLLLRFIVRPLKVK